MERFDKLAAAFLDGEIGRSAEHDLARMLVDDPENLRLVTDLVRIQHLLAGDFSAEAGAVFAGAVVADIKKDTRAFVAEVKREVRVHRGRRRVFWGLAVALAASLLITVGVPLFRGWAPGGAPVALGSRPPKGMVRVTRVLGRLTADGAIVSDAGVLVKVGSRLETGWESQAQVLLSDGSQLEMNQATGLRVGGERTLSLETGELYCQVAPGGRRQGTFTVRGPLGQAVDVLGTKFETEVRAQAMVVLVEEGKVRVSVGGHGEDVRAMHAVVVNGDCFMPVRRITRASIASWRPGAAGFSGADAAARPRLADCTDGRVILRDEFDQGLRNWKPYTIGGKRDAYVLSNVTEHESTVGIQVNPVVRKGRTTRVLAMKHVGVFQSVGVLLNYPDLPPVFSMEFDCRLGRNGQSQYVVTGARKRETKHLVGDMDMSVSSIPQKDWYRNRFEFAQTTDEQGQPCIEARTFINGQLQSHSLQYVNEFYPGVLVNRGSVEVDNVVIREMVPAGGRAD